MAAGGTEGSAAVVDVHTLFLHIAVILLAGKLFGTLFRRFGMPPVLGEVLAGVVIGQSILGIIPLSEAIKVLAELGVILLLFEVGLEADIHMLVRVGLASALVAFLGAALPFAGGFLLSYYVFDMTLLSSLFIGGALTATSIGITVKVLSDLGKGKEKFAQIVLGAAVLDDILGVVILAALYEFSKSGEVNWNATAGLVRDIGIFFVVAPFVARLAAKLIHFIVHRLQDYDIIPPLILSLVLFTGYGAYKVGSPEILGAFTAGLALSRRFVVPFAAFLKLDEKVLHSVEENIRPLVWVVSPIFFVTVGLALNFKAIDFSSSQFWLLSLSLIAVAVLGKVVSGLLIPLSFRDRLNIGLSMMPRGEVGLIFAEFGRSFGAIDEVGYAVVVFVVAVTTLIAPVLLKLNIRT
ncbi:transporter (CPA2 family) [Hydrogenivirga caldilitoris]|uniref:Transporter (CPA2 family) n=1 Tax=Hydrogenivirga caldilitoris TaxID=246264 RepID=A0A497XPI5_9AQUI|nr:cation:proton antiporter [Hydrogenivirga caldilitoris]RLJ70865.1 transporter (CPA2 family) [Hydrogenivirga caldilitoris]